MSKLFKFFGAANAFNKVSHIEENVANKLLREQFRAHIGTNDRYLSSFTKKGEKLMFNEMEMSEMARGLKFGSKAHMEKLFSNSKIPESYTEVLTSQVKHLPHHKSYVNKMFGETFAKKFTTEEFKLLSSKSGKDLESIAKLEKVKAIHTKFRNKRLISFTGKSVLIAASLGTFVLLVENHRKATTGCFMLSYGKNSNLINMCKIRNLSCYDKDVVMNSENVTLCSKLEESVLPENMLPTVSPCHDSNGSGLHCVNCPTLEWEERSQEFIEAWNKQNFNETERDKILVECREPSFFDALSDIVDNVKDTVLNTVFNAIDSIGGTFKTIFKAITVGVVLLIAGFVVYVFIKNFSNIKRQNNGWEKTQIQYKSQI